MGSRLKRSRKIVRSVLMALTVCALNLWLPSVTEAQIVVVVNPSNPLRDLSLEELRRLYLGRTTTFRQNLPVILLEQAELRKAFYPAALGMNEGRIKRHWIGVVFSGESAIPPKTISGSDALKHLVAQTPGAIGFLDFPAADRSVRVLTINGLRPVDASYPLR
jgi:ABC-type phosphate transport system substrate-binding protein